MSVQPAGAGFFPLDEELGLLPGGLSPLALEGLARLSAWMPFAQTIPLLEFFWRLPSSESTVRRRAELAGAAQVALQAAELERLERETPPPPAGPALQQVSTDGCFVPLLKGRWGEVRTVAIGVLEAVKGQPPHATQLSYFSRLAAAAVFSRLALVELHRRGTETAGLVIAVQDGAEWIQFLLDLHRPDAIRVLDFSHAASYLSSAAQAAFGAGTPATAAWVETQTTTLKEGSAAAVLAALRALPVEQAAAPEAAITARDTSLRYLEARLDQLQYATFLALGYPIGSGLVESANKLVVEARLKGSGMHWAPEHVNEMLALRNIVCSERWEETWPVIVDHQAALARARGAARRARRQPPATTPAVATPPRTRARTDRTRPTSPTRAKLVVNGRPTAAHPWRRPFLTSHRPQSDAGAK